MRHTIICLLTLVFFWGCQQIPANTPPEIVSEKRIALTYDDAPRGDGPVYSGKERTQAFLQQLKDAETGPVAIFVTTQGLDKPGGKERIAAYASAGHRIANHSHKHMWASRVPTLDYIADLDRAEEKLQGFENRRPWFRFPYLDEGGRGALNEDLVKRDTLRTALAERELISGYVTVDTFDWHLERLWIKAVSENKSVDMEALSKVYVDLVIDAARHYDSLGQHVLGRRPAQVLLLHENDLAASFSIDLVRGLRADGWTIIDPDEAFLDPISKQIPTTRIAGMGRIAALAADMGLKGQDVFDHWSADENQINARVAADNVFTKED